MLEGGNCIESKISYAFRLATARAPTEEELSVISRLFTGQQEAFRYDRAAADQLLSVGPFTPRPELDRAELAAWSTVASLILNLDETITKG